MTQDKHKTKAELLQELETLRLRISELEQAERQAAEYTLRNSEERYSSLLSNIPDVIWTTDFGGNTTFISSNIEKVYGYSPEEIYKAGDSLWFGRIHPDDVGKVKEAYQSLFEKGILFDVEYRIKRKDGKWIWLHDRSIATYEKDGVMYADGIFSDVTKRKKAGQELKQYQFIVESAHDAIFFKDLKSRYVVANNKALEAFSLPCEKVVGKNDYQIMPNKDEARKNIEDDNIVFKTGKPTEIIKRMTDAEGKQRWFHGIKVPHFDDNGKIIGLVGIARDITDSKKAEEALRESEEKYRVLYETIKDGIAGGPMDGRITECNQAFADMVGYSKDELKKLTYQQITPKRWHQMEAKIIEEQILKHGYSDLYEKQYIRKDGTVFPISAKVWLRTDKDGKPLAMWGIVRDITEQKKAEQALRESQSRQRAILDSIPDIAWLKDKEGRYIAANEALCKAIDIKLEDFIGKTDFDISPEDLAKRYRADDQEVMKSGQRKRVEELWGKKYGKGKRIWIETIKTPIYNDQGQVIGTSGIARDITKRKKAEEQLREYSEKIARAERLASVGTLSATMAHELGQPLTVIGLSIENCLSALKGKASPRLIKEELENALDRVSKATLIIDRFRTLARMSTEKTEKCVNLKTIAERIINLLSETARREKVRLVIKNLDNLPRIYAYEKDIEQMFFMLIQNAIYAADGKKNRQLTISGASTDERVELRFTDTCGGIAPENLDRIFEPFFTTKSELGGLGLGLYIVREIMLRAGGKVRVESKPGKGSTFFINLPIKADKKI